MSSAEDFAAASGSNQPSEAPGDIEMGDNASGAVIIEIDASAGTETGTNALEEGDATVPDLQEPALEDIPARVTYLDYLKSPVISLLVGQGDEQALLNAHQALLCKSPWFEEACGKFSDDVSERRIDLIDEDLDAVGCFLEYLYTNDYFPRKIPGSRDLEQDPAMPDVDETGDQLLKHARVLYSGGNKDDQTIRAPVANFWATRSHTLRSEAETEFREMCLEFPQFGYDVLTRVLDEKLKREKNEKMHPSHGTPGSSRKRLRQGGF
ncbi:hypothetical protein EYC84_011819 [Monilinia fructicola]|uniref:BTB domain-containing protein n=1 Tax=Monilinia fructicola TaxID=38448 RepID=A0A5M9J3W1_MONFR|nr:hypothetical protein EYC84_011819 [Monilinia fructicola]